MTATDTRPVRAKSPTRVIHEDDGGTLWPPQRNCNGCGLVLGDLTNALDFTDGPDDPRALSPGSMVTDVRGECPTCTPGCYICRPDNDNAAEEGCTACERDWEAYVRAHDGSKYPRRIVEVAP